MKKYWKCFIALSFMSTFGLSAQEYRSGDADIDQIRQEILKEQTSEANYRERVLTLYTWMGALQQQGADTRSFFDLDTRYYELEPLVNTQSGSAYKESLSQMYQTIDAGFRQMELIQKDLLDKGPIFTPFEGENVLSFKSSGAKPDRRSRPIRLF